ADEGLALGVELEALVAGLVGDVAQVNQRRTFVADLDVRVGAFPAFDAVDEILLVRCVTGPAVQLRDQLAGSRLPLGAAEDLPAAAVPPDVHEALAPVDFDPRGTLRPKRIFAAGANVVGDLVHVRRPAGQLEGKKQLREFVDGDLRIGYFAV